MKIKRKIVKSPLERSRLVSNQKCDFCGHKFRTGVIVCPEFSGSKCSKCLKSQIKRLQNLLEGL